jgi:hypothetical protein
MIVNKVSDDSNVIRVEKEFSGGREALGVLICPENRKPSTRLHWIRLPVLPSREDKG